MLSSSTARTACGMPLPGLCSGRAGTAGAASRTSTLPSLSPATLTRRRLRSRGDRP